MGFSSSASIIRSRIARTRSFFSGKLEQANSIARPRPTMKQHFRFPRGVRAPDPTDNQVRKKYAFLI
jgi:hypothetical protein